MVRSASRNMMSLFLFLEKGRFDYAELAIRNHVVKIGERILI